MEQVDSAQTDGFVGLKKAHDDAAKILKSVEYARAVVKAALADGTVRARAKVILEEFAYGVPRSLEKRRLDLQIAIYDPPGLKIVLPSEQFLRPAKGSKVIYNWNSGHVAWISRLATPSIAHVAKLGPRVKMPTRKVMYDVEVEKRELEIIIATILKRWNVRATSSFNKSRTYHRMDYYREKLMTFFC